MLVQLPGSAVSFVPTVGLFGEIDGAPVLAGGPGTTPVGVDETALDVPVLSVPVTKTTSVLPMSLEATVYVVLSVPTFVHVVGVLQLCHW